MWCMLPCIYGEFLSFSQWRRRWGRRMWCMLPHMHYGADRHSKHGLPQMCEHRQEWQNVDVSTPSFNTYLVNGKLGHKTATFPWLKIAYVCNEAWMYGFPLEVVVTKPMALLTSSWGCITHPVSVVALGESDDSWWKAGVCSHHNPFDRIDSLPSLFLKGPWGQKICFIRKILCHSVP